MTLNLLISITSGLVSYFLFSNLKNEKSVNSKNDIEKEIKSTQDQLNKVIKIKNISKKLKKSLKKIKSNKNVKKQNKKNVNNEKLESNPEKQNKKNVNNEKLEVNSNKDLIEEKNIEKILKFINKKPIYKKNNLLWYRNNIDSNEWFKAKVNDVKYKNNEIIIEIFKDEDDDGIPDNNLYQILTAKSILNGDFDNYYRNREKNEKESNIQLGGGFKLEIKYNI